jgi:cytidyltransferase-like protein
VPDAVDIGSDEVERVTAVAYDYNTRWNGNHDHTKWDAAGTGSHDFTRTVLCHGTFDLLHLGHIRHLQEARALGDRLVVSVTSDAYVGKGVGRPHFTAIERVEALKALDCVDDAFICDQADAVMAICDVKPAIYCKGVDYVDSDDEVLARERAAVEAMGGVIKFTGGKKWSSSRLINAEKFTSDVSVYLEELRSGGALARIRMAFENADKLRLCFVGETIIDEYRFVSALGKPSKEFVLAAVQTGKEEYLGGVLAAARHGDWPRVDLITAPDSIRKTRFVDADFHRKLFEVYNKKALGLRPKLRAQLDERLALEIGSYDVVIVTDFGHGLLGAPQRAMIKNRAKFLAINAQTNAGNTGFNPVTKWRRADFVCIDEPEARLATSAQDDIGSTWLPLRLSKQMNCKSFLITHGKHGSYWDDASKSGAAPALASAAVDTMGAGDAVIAVTAPLVAAGLDMEAAAFVGNVVGAIKVGILGHRRHVGRQEIMQTVESLLK